LIGISIELYLKCFLNLAGISEKVLQRKPFGHNIAYLHSTAADLFDLHIHQADLKKIIELIGPSYFGHEYRYHGQDSEIGHVYEGQATEAMFHALKSLDESLRQQILTAE
jgi:hypothetical protein